jgi:hypothetical protein
MLPYPPSVIYPLPFVARTLLNAEQIMNPFKTALVLTVLWSSVKKYGALRGRITH